MTRQGLRLVGQGLTYGLGFLGWSWLLWSASQATAWPPVSAFILFLLIVVCARGLAIPLTAHTVVSLDAGFYLAAAACLGPVAGGWLVALALTGDAFWRAWRRGAQGFSALVYALYFGGMSGALLTLFSRWLALDTLTRGEATDRDILVGMLSVGALFLFVHYSIRGVRLALGGHSFRDYVRRAGVPGIVAESALLPLAVVIVFLYQPGEPVRIGVLGAMFLMFNYGFNRIYVTSRSLRLRVSELETLGQTSRRLTDSLQSTELVQTVSRESLAAIPGADALALSWCRALGQPERDGAASGWATVGFLRDGGEAPRDAAHASLVEKVRTTQAPLNVADRAGGRLSGNRRIRSWLGVPLTIHDEVVGVLSVASTAPEAFGPHERRLLSAIGTQAGVALQNARLYELAMVDGLTKLFVRRYFDARLDEEVHRSMRFGTVFSVVMMDVDNFKALNDRYGHQVGDQLLAGFAEVVRRELRAVDTAARYGGEEFALILPRTTLVDALTMAERIRQAVSEFSVQVEGAPVGTTASFGIASFPESGAESADEVVRLADHALYRAKRSGKDRVELSWPSRAAETAP